MSEHDLHLKWDTGGMLIHMDEFFPCSQKDFIFLVKKVINLDYRWDTHSAAVGKLKFYLQERMQHLPQEIKEKQQQVVEIEKKMFITKVALKAAVKAEKRAIKENGVTPNCKSYEELKNQYECYQELMRKAKADVHRLANAKCKFVKYLEILESEW